MTAKQEILDALRDVPVGLCTACLEKVTSLSPQPYIRGVCVELERLGLASRDTVASVECSRCGAVRILNRPRGIRSNERVSDKLIVHVEELDRLRRAVIRYLDFLDGCPSREGYSARITRLRNEEKLPGTIASLMLTRAKYRNEMTYEALVATDRESSMLREVTAIISEYIGKATSVDRKNR